MGAIALVAAAAVAGMVNALAGGGSLITFPVLLATGMPAVVANVTNTLALVPGYVGGLLSQRQDLRGQSQRIQWLVPAAAAGGLAGALLLLNTSERLFSSLKYNCGWSPGRAKVRGIGAVGFSLMLALAVHNLRLRYPEARHAANRPRIPKAA